MDAIADDCETVVGTLLPSGAGTCTCPSVIWLTVFVGWSTTSGVVQVGDPDDDTSALDVTASLELISNESIELGILAC